MYDKQYILHSARDHSTRAGVLDLDQCWPFLRLAGLAPNPVIAHG